MERIILHADMNNCYASIEAKLNPKLKGRPIAVCGSVEDRHGIVLAKSQEAKASGVKTGEAIWQAKNKCRNLIIVPPNFEEYLKHSRMAREIYLEYTNQVEPFGIDECWLDVTNSKNLFGNGQEIAEILRKRIKSELGITISVGVSFNKVFAKLGSDLKKPDAVTNIPQSEFKKIVWSLKVDEMIGIGRATKKKLIGCGILTLGDLANSDVQRIKNLLGKNGVYLWQCSNGRDFSPVKDNNFQPEIKSIGRGITCREDLINLDEIRRVFRELSFLVSKKLREFGFWAKGVQITIRDNELNTKQYQAMLENQTQNSLTLTDEAMEIFRNKHNFNLPLRSITLRAINLSNKSEDEQLNFFDDYETQLKKEKVDRAIYEIRKRYGKEKISFASQMFDLKLPKILTSIQPFNENKQKTFSI